MGAPASASPAAARWHKQAGQPWPCRNGLPRLGAWPRPPRHAPLCPLPCAGAMDGGDSPAAAQPRCSLAPLRAAVTAQRLHASARASWTFSRTSGGASGAAGGKAGLRDRRDGCQEGTWVGASVARHARGGARAAAEGLGERCPRASTRTHRGTWRSRGCPSWRGWHRRPVGTPGAGSASPPTAGQKEGLSTGVGGLEAPQGAVGPQDASCWAALPPVPEALGTGTGPPSSSPGATRGPGALTTHQHRIHFISPKGGTEGCQLSLLRYQRRPKRHARGPSACMVSASSGLLFSGAARKGTGKLPARGRGTPQHCWWWHEGAVPGRRGARVPGHCLQQSEGLARTGLAQVSRGHCTFSQCTSPVVPCGEAHRAHGGAQGSRYKAHGPAPRFEPLLQCPVAEGTHGCWGSSATRPG